MKAKQKRWIGYGMFIAFLAACIATMTSRLVMDEGWLFAAQFWLALLAIMFAIVLFGLVAMKLIESKDKP